MDLQKESPVLDSPLSMDSDEASRDPGAFASHSSFTDEDFEVHRAHTVYIGLHMPPCRKYRYHKHHSHHNHHHHHHHYPKSEKNNHGSFKPVTPPAERVQFILGEDEGGTHEPHPIFSEMEELFRDGDELEWRETARWIKYEEDVEQGGNRWSKPHVATLSLHSLFELRSLILNGIIMLDIEATTLDQISDLIVTKMVNLGHLKLEHKDQMKKIILRRHTHQYERHHDWTERGSRLPLISSLAEIGRISSKGIFGIHCSSVGSSNENIPENSSSSSLQSSEVHFKVNQAFMRKIPQGAEASNLLIGEENLLERPVFAFVRLSQAHNLGDLTEVPLPTRFIFLLLGPTCNNRERYHEAGRSMATLMSDEVFHSVAYKAKSCEDIIAGIDEFLDAVTVLPPGAWDPSIRIEPPCQLPSQEARKKPDSQEPKPEPEEIEIKELAEHGLSRTGRCFGGLINDIKRKKPWYISDFTDGVALQSLASIIYLYFACLAPIITFGGLLGDATRKRMAAIESLLSGAICGITYGLCSGQPLTILGSTGPVLLLESIVFDMCIDYHLEYLPLRVWIGLWVSGILLVCVAFDTSTLVRYITRFTEENFATLIALIFIYKAIEKVINIGYKYPLSPTPYHSYNWDCSCELNSTTLSASAYNWTSMNRVKEECKERKGSLVGEGCSIPYFVPDVFLFSLILFASTFAISITLKKMNTTPFFPMKIRQSISDFAVVIAILLTTLLDTCVGLDTPKLEVPQEFKPTWSKRTWLVPMFGKNPWWTAFAALLPATVASILIFMDQQITAVIVNRKENKIKKGCGYHLDLLIVAILIAVCSILGLPWFVAATVLSMTHVNSLKIESESSAPGEKPQFLGVREQRVTSVSISVLIGLSVFFTPLLKHIPMPVLFGVFLYMGFSSLKGLQLVDRVLIILMPQKYQPDYMFLRHVPTWRVHLYTAIQVLCLGCLWFLKSYKYTAIFFPVLLLIMVVLRKGLDFIFEKQQLLILDDPMPAFHKAKHKEKRDEESSEENSSSLANGSATKLAEIKCKDDHVQCSINISEQLVQSNLWKSIDQQIQNSPPPTQQAVFKLKSDFPISFPMKNKAKKEKTESDKSPSPKLDNKENKNENSADSQLEICHNHSTPHKDLSENVQNESKRNETPV